MVSTLITSNSVRPIIALGCAALRQYMVRRLSVPILGFIDNHWDAPFDSVTGLPVFQSPDDLPLPVGSYDYISFGGLEVCNQYRAKFNGLRIIAEHPVQLYRSSQWASERSPLARLKDSFEEHGEACLFNGEPRVGALRQSASPEVICLVIHRLTFGGAERQVCLLAKGLRALGFHVHLLCFFPAHTGYTPMLEELRNNDVAYSVLNARHLVETTKGDVFVSGVSKSFVGLFSGVFQEFIIDGLYRYFRQTRPTVVISYLESSNLLSGIAGIYAGVPRILMSGRNVSLNELEDPSEFCGEIALQRELYRVILKFPNTRLFTNSAEGSRSYAQWLGLPTMPKVVGNAFDALTAGHFGPLKKRNTDNSLVVGMMARLAKEKSPLRFIDLVEHLRSLKVYDTRGIYKGDGPLRGQFVDTVSDRGLSSFVELLSASQETNAFWDSIDIFVLTSNSEGTPNVIMECIQRRVPFVTTCLGSMSEIPSPWLRFMVSSQCPKEMSEKILFLMRHVSDIDWGTFHEFSKFHDPKWLAKKTLEV